MRAIALAAVILFIFCSCPSASAVTRYDDITVSLEAPSYETTHGYADYRVSIVNDSPSKTHSVTVFAPAQPYGHGDHIRRIERTVVLGPSSSARVSLLQPSLPMQGNALRVIIDGTYKKETVPGDFSGHCRNVSWWSYGPSSVTCALLLSRGVNTDNFLTGARDAVFGKGSSSSSSGYASSDTISAGKSESEVDQWSTDWLSYSRFDGVVITAPEMERMPEPVKAAVARYVRCGGSLLVLGNWQPPPAWRCAEISEEGRLNWRYMHFGVLINGDEDFQSWPESAWQHLYRSVWSPAARQLSKRTTVVDANSSFTVVDAMGIPIRGLFVLVLTFVIVMGPVNLFLLSRKKRRIWMLWTVPALAITASLAVITYSTFAEGWHATARIHTVSFLDEHTNEATTIGIAAYYCPMTPRGGLRCDTDTELTAISLEDYSGGRARTVDWTKDQHLASGWIAARVPTHFMLRKSQTRRERVRIRRLPDGQIAALNGLGADIADFRYADDNGDVYTASDIRAGEQKTLTRSGDKITAADNAFWRTQFTSSWTTLTQQISINPTQLLQKQTYICVLNDLVFAEQMLPAVRHKNYSSVIIGTVKGAQDGSQDPQPEEIL